MAETSISWTDVVWNPIVGCSRVSAGCEHCYAERFAHRGLAPQHRGLTVIGKDGPRWTGEVRLVPEMLSAPLKWKKPRAVFVNSMSDLFHTKVPFEYIAAVFGVMAACPQHTFIVLTKRDPRKWFDWVEGNDRCSPEEFVQREAHRLLPLEFPLHPIKGTFKRYPWPLPNVALGVSCENQAAANERVPWLLQTPAACRIVSAEPCIGPVCLSEWLHEGTETSLFGSGSARMVHDQRGWNDLEECGVSRRRSSDHEMDSSSSRGKKCVESQRVSPDHVLCRRQEDEGGSASNSVDAPQSPGHAGNPGDQPQRRSQVTQPSRQSGAQHEKRECKILPISTPEELQVFEYSGRQGRRKPRVETHRHAGKGNSQVVQAEDHVPAGDSSAICNNTSCRIENNTSQELGVPGIDLVIVGGESGPNARPCNIEWIRSIVRQCREANVPAFVKQLGSNATHEGLYDVSLNLKDRKGADMSEWPDDLQVRELPWRSGGPASSSDGARIY